jgi:hypothetical protein
MIGRFGQLMKFVPLLATQDITATATNTSAVDLARCHRATFFIPFGSVSAVCTTDTVTVTVLASSVVTSGTGTAIAFNYRISGAIGTDSWGAVTAATATGYAMAASLQNNLLLIDVDPDVVLNGVTNLNGRYVRVVITPTAGAGHTFVSCIAELEPRYAQTNMESAS